MSDETNQLDVLPKQRRNSKEKAEHLPMSHPQIEQELGAQFLLADFNSLREFMTETNARSGKRIDVFLALTSVLGTGLVLLSQTHMDRQAFLILGLLVSVSLFLIGIATLGLVISWEIIAVDYIRAINRIRGYFAEDAPHIKPFLLMSTSAEFPSYGSGPTYQQIVVVINSILAGASIGIISLLLRQVTLLDLTSLAFACISVLITYSVQTLYAKRRYNWAEANSHKRYLADKRGLKATTTSK